MALLRSLSSGVSSLRAHQQRLDVLSNNIANVNTTGFKGSRVNFVDQFNQTLRVGNPPAASQSGGAGGLNPTQVGLGVRVGNIQQDMSQGSISVTSSPTDLAMQGEGFFVVRQVGINYFTRSGNFTFDRDGFLVDNSTGAYVQGYNLARNNDGSIQRDQVTREDGGIDLVNRLQRASVSVRVDPNTRSQPRQTQQISVSGNLNSNAPTGNQVVTNINIFDNQGTQRVLQMLYTKQAAPNTFSLQARVQLADGTFANVGAAQAVTFNADGTLASIGADNTLPVQMSVNASDLNTALGLPSAFDQTLPRNLSLTFARQGNILGGLTQFASQDTAAIVSQDGYGSGEISRISVDSTGKVIGAFTNGISEILAQVVTAKFTNPSGLLRGANNYYTPSPNSGLANIQRAQEDFPSTSITSNALEQSNVDLTEEFTDMIATQRAFEAASRTVTTSDQFLQEINQLKR